MSITTATIEDVAKLNQLINFAYRGSESKKGWTTEADILDGIRIDESSLIENFNNSAINILKYTDEDGQILGTVCLEVKHPILYLGMFAVSPISQGKGIGKALLKEAEVFAKQSGCNTIAISVISSRTELIDWYAGKGYVHTGNSTAFEEIEGKFGEPKIEGIRLDNMEKKLTS
ncbi:GNAT family N-acetyltransferase [Pedobacter jejuensis]|uniref:GNAT family N-acetyltransferase n=1 Tax=Pedobacter jejuensis TaxID=1268550 RepID=A0A3N0C1D3_9SPHI|nr:GNAT family N-acetyltransferase [Pedobacter jejuensis]RNL55874.1 GNAT family N-acetyltransferase [Pedobacter jejuensis]